VSAKANTRESAQGQGEGAAKESKTQEGVGDAVDAKKAQEETQQLREALAEIDRLKQEVEASAAKDAELERLKEELAAAKEAQTVDEQAFGKNQRASIGGIPEATDSEESDNEGECGGIIPVPPDSDAWEWPLSRQEKKARVQLLERQINAIDRNALIKECRRASMASTRNSFGACED
jgi:hypothetical protein